MEECTHEWHACVSTLSPRLGPAAAAGRRPPPPAAAPPGTAAARALCTPLCRMLPSRGHQWSAAALMTPPSTAQASTQLRRQMRQASARAGAASACAAAAAGGALRGPACAAWWGSRAQELCSNYVRGCLPSVEAQAVSGCTPARSGAWSRSSAGAAAGSGAPAGAAPARRPRGCCRCEGDMPPPLHAAWQAAAAPECLQFVPTVSCFAGGGSRSRAGRPPR